MKLKRKLLDAVIILGIAFLMLSCCEIALRLVYPEKTKSTSREPGEPAYEFNRGYLVSLKPNVEKTFVRTLENGGDVIRWKTNSHRFRGSELREDAAVRIVVYGDSSIQARFSDLQDTYTRRLEKRLQETTGKDVEVVNAGVIGFGPDQSLIRFSEEVDVYHPDIVVFHVFADNDFGDLVRNRLFGLGSSGCLVEASHETSPDQVLLGQQQPRTFRESISSLLVVRAARKACGMADSHTRTEGLRQSLISLAEQEYSVYKESKPRSYSHFADHYDIDVALFPESESSKTKIKLMNAVLNEAKTLADSKNVEFLVVIQPSVRDLTTNTPMNYQDFREYPGYKRTALTSAVDEICIQSNMHRVNLFKLFLQNKPSNLYFKHDDHWSNAGQEIAARETAGYIAENMLSRQLKPSGNSNDETPLVAGAPGRRADPE